MTTGKESYLGDGLYVCITEMGIRLRAPRLGGDHVVYFDDETLDAFLVWLGNIRKTALAKGEPQ
jgi:hypothetical protein